ncbi:MAG: alpha/beta fold hydrolase [Gemmatimonadota bacterium]
MRPSVLLGCAGLLVMGLLAHSVGAQVRAGHQGMLGFDGGQIFYEVVGEGAPVIVVHGGPGLDHNYLRPGLDVLARSSTLIYYDQRGLGRSVAPLDPEHINLDAFLEDVESLRKTLGYDRMTLLGHSYGSLLALAYALAHPARTRALILVAPVEPGARWREEAGRRAAEARSPGFGEELARLSASPGYEARDPDTLSEIYRLAYRSTFRNPERIDDLDLRLSRQTALNGSEVARLLGTSLGPVDWWEDLSRLTVSTLVIHGRYDVMPVAMSRALVSTLPHARLAILESGHFPFVEDPAGLVSAVEGFLAGMRP